MNTSTTSVGQLKRAIGIAEQIEKLQKELSAILGGKPAAPSKAAPSKAAPSKNVRKKRRMSPEARARIVAAVKARWAKVKAQKKAPAAATPAAKPKVIRQISPEARARMVEGAKKRWADKKAAQEAPAAPVADPVAEIPPAV